MRHLNLWILFLGLVTISCTIPDPLSGHCGNDYWRLGDAECQCVTPDNEDSEGSVSYEEGASYDNLDYCRDPNRTYAQNLSLDDNDIYVCLSYRCATKTCPDGKMPDKAKRKCIAKVDCPDPKEVYDREKNACQCDGDKHFTGKAGQCTCQKGYVYDASTSSCRCPEGFEEAKDGNQCVASACDGENEIRGDNGACVCDEDSLRFEERCIKPEECTGKRVNNKDGTCSCFGLYTYILGDCFVEGDIVTFGRYPQNEQSMEPTPLSWRILEITDNAALLLSEYILEQYTYHDQNEGITWEWSNVRSYLNGFGSAHNKNGINHENKGFIDVAFTAEERKQIKTVINTNPDANYSPGGNDTEDRVFLLTRDEVFKYFPTNQSRLASPTSYAIHPPTSSGRKNLWTCEVTCSDNNTCSCQEGTGKRDGTSVQICLNAHCVSNWLTRSPGLAPDPDSSPGMPSEQVVAIYCDGRRYSNYVLAEDRGLRPALYVDLKSEL